MTDTTGDTRPRIAVGPAVQPFHLAVLEALGLDPHTTQSIRLDLDAGLAPRVHVTRLLRMDDVDRLTRVVERFDLTPVEAPRD